MLLILLGGGLLIGGCNVFDFANSSPETVDALLDSARSALAAGNSSRAVRLLEQAFKKDSTDVRVRVELGNALHTDRGLDIFALRSAGKHLVIPADSAISSRVPSSGSTPKRTVCTDEAQPRQAPNRYTAVPLDAEPLRFLSARRTVVERVHDLVVEGVLRRRTEAFMDTRIATRRKGLLVGAVTTAAKQLIDVQEVFEETGGTLFLDRGAEQGRALLACTETEEALRRSNRALCTLGGATRQAIRWLRDRQQPSEDSQEAVLIDRLQSVTSAASARTACSKSPSVARPATTSAPN
ncbi:hypothetical protein [Salinibacter sp.]|uniref:hypothetical protein n=1 Tax=Salinibacter sp. TaxID=2065818 RepID=UPI0035D4EE77